MVKFKLSLPLLTTVVSLICFALPAMAQEHSQKFAHIQFPEEIKVAVPNIHNAFAQAFQKVYRINTVDWTFEEVYDISDKGPFKNIQALTTAGDNVYWYVGGEGIYRMAWDGKEQTLVRPASKDFKKNIEEAYSGMNIDPTGQYLLLYGKNENVAVFDIHALMKPVVAFNDFVNDAFWINNKLYAGCLDKVVINTRKGRSIDNQDFIFYGDNDQTGMTKIHARSRDNLPNMGQEDVTLDEGGGDMIQLIYNKVNGDVLMCVESSYRGPTRIYRVNGGHPLLVAELEDTYQHFAAYGDKIIAATGYDFTETQYGSRLPNSVKSKKIKTDLIPAPKWPGHKPEPLEIDGAHYMDYDKDGNLWIVKGRNLYVIFNQAKK